MPLEPWNRRSTTSRVLLAAYLCALLYGSLYPWTGWRSLGGSSLGFLTDPWPRYWTWFDLLANLALYAPVGALAQLSLVRGRGTWRGVAACVAAASLLSLAIEATQSFMPGRVPSRLDWIANTAGTLAGATLGALAWRLERRGLIRPPPTQWRRQTAAGPALLIAWVLMQINPQRLLFGSGDFIGMLATALEQFFDQTAGDDIQSAPGVASIVGAIRLDPDHTVLAEAAGTSLAVLAIGMLVREVFARSAPRHWITGVLLVAALSVRGATATVLFGPGQALSWLSAGAQGGLLTGLLLIAVLALAQRRTRLLICIAALALNIAVTCTFPVDAYYDTSLGRWDHGGWRHLTALLRTVSIAWPFAAIAWCVLRLPGSGRNLGSIIRGR